MPFFLFALDGKVIKVADGDTLTILTNSKEQVKVRLYGIDAPEKAQAFGLKSKQNLSDLCAGENAHVEERGKDKYKRTIGIVTCKGIEANRRQVQDGFAWAYVYYSKDYIQEEILAHKAKLGLWSQKAIAPWDFRASQKEKIK